MSNQTWALQQALQGGSPTVPEHDNSMFISLLDRLREEHELQISSLTTTITELSKNLRKVSGAKSVQIFEPTDDGKDEKVDRDRNAPGEGEGSMALSEIKDSQSGSGSPKLQRKPTQAGSQFAHLGILHNNMNFHAEEQITRYKKFQRFVQSAVFETTFAALIVFNALVMAADVQRSGTDIGATLGYADYEPTHVTLPWAEDVFIVLEYLFGVAFTLEILMKVVALKIGFLKDLWNWFDTFLVACWYIDILSRTDAGEGMLPVNTTLLRLLRLMRLLRLLRLVRLIKTFDSLYLMTTALKGSALILTWACVLLLVLQVLIALLLNQVLYDAYLEQTKFPIAERLEVFEYFGTFTRSMLSMFEITLGNWPPVCRLLSEKVSEWFMLLCILHKLVIGFAVVGVINGVFIQETFKVASSDNQIMMRQKERSSNLHEMKMRQLFMEADNDGDGFVSAEEWRELVSHPAVQLWLGSMDLDAADADGLYALIHDLDQDGDLTMDELIRGVARLKGTARSYDLQMLLRQVLALTDAVDLLKRSVDRKTRSNEADQDDIELQNDTGGEGRVAHLMYGAAWRRT